MPKYFKICRLPYSCESIFNLVADVESYPDFLPWCIATRIRSTDETHMSADMVIGFKMFREQFTSSVILIRPRNIQVEYENGPFKHLKNHWIFDTESEGNCLVDFSVDFEFSSQILERAIGKVFTGAVQRMVSSFEKRAKILYA